MPTYIFFMLSLLLTHHAIADIYKWTDGNGSVNFSDTPKPGAEKVTLPNTQSYAPSPEPLANHGQKKTAAKDFSPHHYDITITQPINNATIRNNLGAISVVAAIEPTLKQGDKLQLIFDGQPVGTPQQNVNFTLSDINRGTHTVVVQALDNKNNTLSTSDSLTFFVQRSRVGMVHGR